MKTKQKRVLGKPDAPAKTYVPGSYQPFFEEKTARAHEVIQRVGISKELPDEFRKP